MKISCKFGEHVFAFYAEIQDGRQKQQKNDFWGKVARRLALNAETQDGRQKWRENDFLEKSPVDSEIPCGSKISSKLLSRSVSEINAFLRFQR